MTLKRAKLNVMSAKQRAKFAAAGVAFPMSTFRPVQRGTTKAPKMSAARAKRPADTGPDKATVDAVWKRDEGKCVPCGDPLYGRRGIEWSVSHRKLRSQGGDNRLSNLMLSCGNGISGCEGSIHAHPERAGAAGWMVRRDEDPAQVPLEHSGLGHGRLDDGGGWTPEPEQEACA